MSFIHSCAAVVGGLVSRFAPRRAGLACLMPLSLMAASTLTGRLVAAELSATEPAAELRPAAGTKKLPQDLALIRPDAVGFCSVRVGDLFQETPMATGLDAIAAGHPDVEGSLGCRLRNIERLTVVLRSYPLRPSSVMVIVRGRRPFSEAKALRSTLGEPVRWTLGDRAYYTDRNNSRAAYFINDQLLVLCHPSAAAEVFGQPGERTVSGPLAPMIEQAAGKHAVTAALDVRAIDQIQRFSDDYREGPFGGLSGTRLLTVVADGPGMPHLNVGLHFENLAGAAAGEKSVAKLLLMTRLLLGRTATAPEDPGATLSPLDKAVRDMYPLLAIARPELSGSVVRVQLGLPEDAGNFLTAVAETVDVVREAPLRLESQNKLGRIGAGLKRYIEATKALPPAAVIGRDGKPLLSWRVALLPYLGEEELYRKFRLDEPWDSPANRPLLQQIPDVYRPVVAGKATQPGATFYQVLVGPNTPFAEDHGVNPATVSDPSNTILVAEGGSAVPWTKPVDLRYGDRGPFGQTPDMPALGGQFYGGVSVVTMNGAARFLPKSTPEKQLRRMIEREHSSPVVLGAPR